MVQVICCQCMGTAYAVDGQDVHEVLQCACCAGDHHHGQAAAECPREHDGPCWSPGPGPGQVRDRPDGCGVCRPLLIRPMAVMTLGG